MISKIEFEIIARGCFIDLFNRVESDIEDESSACLFIHMINALEYGDQEKKIISMMKECKFISAKQIADILLQEENKILLSFEAIMTLTKYNTEVTKSDFILELENLFENKALCIYDLKVMKKLFYFMKSEKYVLDLDLVGFVLTILSEADDYKTWGCIVQLFLIASEMDTNDVVVFVETIIRSDKILDVVKGDIHQFFDRIKCITHTAAEQLIQNVCLNKKNRIVEGEGFSKADCLGGNNTFIFTYI